MRALQLDYQRVGRARGAGVALLAFGLISALLVLLQYRGVSQETESYREVVSKYQALNPAQRAPAPALDAKQAKAQEERLASAKAVIDRLALPWGELLGALEEAADEDVALLQLSPDPDKRQVKLLAEAKNLAAMLLYHKLLEQSEVLTEVALVNHDIQEQDPDKPVRFNITAQWLLTRDARQ